MKTKSKAKSFTLNVIVLVVLLALLMGLYVNVSENKIFKASAVSLHELYGNINDGFIAHTEKQWNMLETIRPFLEKGSMQVDTEYLLDLQKTWNFTDFFFMQHLLKSAFQRL